MQKSKDSKPVFLATPYPTNRQVEQVIRKIATKVMRWLAKQIDETNNENTDDQTSYATMMAASIRYRIGLGSRAGQRVQRYGMFTQEFIDQTQLRGERCASLDGFSVHANTRCKAHQRGKLEKLCRYIARPPFAMSRITQSKDKIVYELKRPFPDGTSHLIFTAEEFLEKLAAIVPLPRANLVRYHGVFAPNAKLRRLIVPTPEPVIQATAETTLNKNKSMTWARMLKRVFDIDINMCTNCGGENVRVIAAITKRQIIVKILKHLRLPTEAPEIAPARAPPVMNQALFSDYDFNQSC